LHYTALITFSSPLNQLAAAAESEAEIRHGGGVVR